MDFRTGFYLLRYVLTSCEAWASLYYVHYISVVVVVVFVQLLPFCYQNLICLFGNEKKTGKCIRSQHVAKGVYLLWASVTAFTSKH